MSDYLEFIKGKQQYGKRHGFDPVYMPDWLFDFQSHLVEWALLKGRSAIFADCGLGKGPMALVWAQNVVQYSNKRTLIVAPLAVSHQFLSEGEKFGIECVRSTDGRPKGNITVTNYERLHLFDRNDYSGVVCDESSILKNFDGVRKATITEFLRKIPYRLLCTATAAPNDYIELGTTSEALGEMGFMDMLNRFFKNDQNTSDTKRQWRAHGTQAMQWRFKKHAQQHFWRWVCSWARAIRKPSDLWFDDSRFALPELIERQTIIDNAKPFPGELFVRPAVGLREQREELRNTLTDRCEKAAELVNNNSIAVVWCHLNDEGDLLEKLIHDSVQVSGKDSDDAKEEKLQAFSRGQIRVLVTKSKIAGFGLNWQHCAHTTVFPSHSFEQYYQSIRRFWRFGQTKPVIVDIVTTKGGEAVLKNLQRKSTQAQEMFRELICHMTEAISIDAVRTFANKMEVPQWLSSSN